MTRVVRDQSAAFTPLQRAKFKRTGHLFFPTALSRVCPLIRDRSPQIALAAYARFFRPSVNMVGRRRARLNDGGESDGTRRRKLVGGRLSRRRCEAGNENRFFAKQTQIKKVPRCFRWHGQAADFNIHSEGPAGRVLRLNRDGVYQAPDIMTLGWLGSP